MTCSYLREPDEDTDRPPTPSARVPGGERGAGRESAKALEEYAVECAVNKVFASEVLDEVVDETVQIFGGYGYIEEYGIERAYRDARINRIWEGTKRLGRIKGLKPIRLTHQATRCRLCAGGVS